MLPTLLQGLIAGVLLGLNTTVFAYGATGSGKTYTMVGTPTDPGIMVLSMSDIFAFMVRSGPCTLLGPLHLHSWLEANLAIAFTLLSWNQACICTYTAALDSILHLCLHSCLGDNPVLTVKWSSPY